MLAWCARCAGAVALNAGLLSAQGRSVPAPNLAAFDKYVAASVREWHAPGLAIAIVRGDSVVFAKGYGVLDVRNPERVTEHTRFAIGSTTKAMTAMAVGMLVDDGKLRWDDRVIDYLPALRLSDPYVTRELTIRDLLTHRSGLPGTDLLWARGDLTFDEMMTRLRHVQPSSSFRSRMEYQNVVYAIAGAVVAKVSGMSWDAFVRARILTPLGMTETEPLVSGIVGRPNVATPHAEVRDTVRPVPIRSTDAIAPAGSVWSSIADMAKWMRCVLDSGRVNGGTTRLVTPATFVELVTPQIRAPLGLYPALALVRPHGFSYALGWFVEDYQGQTLWMHTGSIDGMSAIIGLQPDRRVGVYVLANLDHAELRHALMYAALDLYSTNPTRDWSAELRTLLGNAERAAAARGNRGAADTASHAPPAPSLPLERYAGTYVDSTYGALTVSLVEGTLQARFGKEDLGTLTATGRETFRATAPPPDESRTAMTFVIDGAGNVASVRVFGVAFVRTDARRPPG